MYIWFRLGCGIMVVRLCKIMGFDIRFGVLVGLVTAIRMISSVGPLLMLNQVIMGKEELQT